MQMTWYRVRRAAIGVAAIGLVGALIARGDLLRPLWHAALGLGRLRPETVGLALSCMLLSILINGGVWGRLLSRLGYALPARVGLGAFLSANLAGYVVNLAGPALGCAFSLRRHGVCPTRAVLLSVMGNALGLAGVLVWVPAGLVLLSRTGMDTSLPLLRHTGPVVAAIALAGLAAAMIVVLRALASAPYAGSRLARRILGRHGEGTRATSQTATPSLRTRHLLGLVPWSACAWFAGTLAIYVVLGGLNPKADLSPGDVIGSAALAEVLGALAFFVPEGMGVREGSMIALLAHATGLPVASCTGAVLLLRGVDPLLKLAVLLVLSSHIERAPFWRAIAARRPAFGLRADGPRVSRLLRLRSVRIGEGE